MTLLRSFIVDDEAPARQRLRRLLSARDDVEIVGEAADGVSALEQLRAIHADVVFLDIDMPELDGMAVAEALPADGPAVVFVTAYDAHALRAFEVAAVDYLVKPIVAQRLDDALTRDRSRQGSADIGALLAGLNRRRPLQRMAVRCGSRVQVFDPAAVSAVLARDHYSAILTGGKELLSDDSLDDLERRFDPERFVRVHRSALVNVAFVKELIHEGDRRYLAVLTDLEATRVPISRERLGALKAAIGLK
jgi:two-component system, LytTR family, response regulator